MKADPELAGELLEGAVYDGGRSPFERASISLLAASDPAEAIAYAQSLGVIGSDPVPRAVKAIAEHDPARAAREVEAMSSSRSKALSTVELAKTWAARDQDAAAAWVRELPEGPVRHYALVAAASASGYHDPERALDLVMEAGRTGGGDFFSVRGGSLIPLESNFKPDADRTAGDLLRRMVETDPGAAVRYLREKVPAEWREDLAAATGLR